MSEPNIVDEIEERAADALHAGAHESYIDALWAVLVAAEPEARSRYLWSLLAAYAEQHDEHEPVAEAITLADLVE